MSIKTTSTTLAILAAAFIAALPQLAQAQSKRNELGIQHEQGLRSADPDRYTSVFYRREFGDGWTFGGAVGYGEVFPDLPGNAFAIHLGYRFQPAPALLGLRPQLAVEFAHAFSVFEESRHSLRGVAGVSWELTPRIGLNLDALFGRARHERETAATRELTQSNTAALRLGVVVKF